MTIKKIIHQTWKTENIPLYLSKYVASWVSNNSDWEYLFWTDEQLMNLVETEFPSLLQNYRHFPKNIMRVDVARYCILMKYGGVYADLDFECYQPIHELLSGNHDLILSWEWPGAKREGVSGGSDQIVRSKVVAHYKKPRENPNTISNALIISSKNHTFWDEIIKDLSRTVFPERVEHRDVWSLTGPDYLTRMFIEHYSRTWNAELLDNSLFFPIDWHEPMIDDGCRHQDFPDAYGAHHWAGSWWKKQPAHTSQHTVNIHDVLANPEKYHCN